MKIYSNNYRLCFTILAISALFIAVYSCTSVVENDEPISPDWPHAVTYEIFVHAFADGSGDGIGDFQGLTSKLDYLADLGIKGLWLMPIHPSPSYHKYDVIDYREIHPDYGTMDDFQLFLSEAHARDIRVVIDFVVNHSGRDHPWFQNALADTTSPYFDFYIWENEDDIESLTVEYTGPDTDNVRRWNEVEELGMYYYSYFWAGMPDLNYDNPAVRDTIYDIGRFWLEDIGVDGFRLDAARHIFPEHRVEDIHAFWEEFRAEMEKVNPEVYLVGEVWSDTETVKPYLTGLPALFNFDMGYAMMEAAETGSGSGLAAKHAGIRDAYQSVADDFIDATFLTNHDQNRVMSVLDDDENKARVAASLLLTMPGAPYIYYGEEIGMRGMKPDPNIREPILWTEEPDEMRSRWIEPEYTTDETVVPVSVQLEDEQSLLHHYKRLIALRNSEPVLTLGEINPMESTYEELVVFRRTYHDNSLLVVHNVSGGAIEKNITSTLQAYDSFIYQSDDAIELTDSTLTLPAQSSAVLYQSGQ